MPKYITQLRVSLNEYEGSELRERGFTRINVDLNKGAGGNYIYLWYQKGQGEPITRIQFSFINDMSKGLIAAGYTKIDKDLNTGAGGDFIYLWYYRGSSEYDVPIMDLQVTTEPADEAPKFDLGLERSACNLNRKAEGNRIHLWVKRERPTYICDVIVTDTFGSDAGNFQKGYIRVDEDTNRGAGGNYVYIWYRQTTDPQRGIKDLKISTSDEEYETYKKQQYHPVNVNLNQGTRSKPVYLWYKRDDCSIRSLSLICRGAVGPLEKAGIQVIKKDINTGGTTEYLCLHR